MTTPLEDRLRAHYQERTTREALPGPDEDQALAHTLHEAARRTTATPSRPGLGRSRLLIAAAAAVVLLVAGVAAFVTTRDDDGPSVSTEGDPDRSTTSDDTRPGTSTSSSAPPSTSSTSGPPGTDAPPPPTDLSVVVGLDGVLGWWDGSRSLWMQADSRTELPVESGEEYQVLRIGDAPQTRAGQLGEVTCLEGGGTQIVDVGMMEPATNFDPLPIAVTGVADPQPRPVAAVDTGNADHRASAVEVLADLGVDDPEPEIIQAVRVDLDGDGADEVLVTAERIANPDTLIATEGDYSVTFLRHVVDGTVEATVVAQSLAPTDPTSNPYIQSHRVTTAADLNGDGRMEVVVSSHYYEGRSTVVYEIATDGTATQVLTGGCGS